MKKLNHKANVFFEKNKKQGNHSQDVTIESFLTTLTPTEETQIEKLFLKEDDVATEDVISGVSSIKFITSQIKLIQKQHVLLVGEKIFKAREIIQGMGKKDTTFTSWVNLVFPTKSSAYNALAYYEFFIKLPDNQVKKAFQSLPYKTAYALASRRGENKVKMSVLSKIRGKNNQEAMCILNTYLPARLEPIVDDNQQNKILSSKLLEVLKLVTIQKDVSEYNKGLVKLLYETLNGKPKNKKT